MGPTSLPLYYRFIVLPIYWVIMLFTPKGFILFGMDSMLIAASNKYKCCMCGNCAKDMTITEFAAIVGGL